MSINKITLPNGTTHNLVPGAGDITVKSKLYFEAVNEDNVTYKKLVAEYVPPGPEDIDTAGTLTVYDLDGNTMFTMDMNGNRFNLLRVVNTLIAGTLRANNLTANRILVPDANKNIVSSSLSVSDLITTSNIGSQSVKSATSAGSATNATYINPLATGRASNPNDGNSIVIFKRVTNTEAPNNGVVLEFGNSTSWRGQLYIGDNSTQGIAWNGWSNGTRGSWLTFLHSGNYSSYALPLSGGNVTGEIRLSNKSKVYNSGNTLILGSGDGVSARKYDNLNTYIPMSASGFVNQSSRLVKENVEPITEERAKKLLNLNVVTFDYIKEVGGAKNKVGLIAEDTLDILPDIVTVPTDYDEEETKEKIKNNEAADVMSIDYSKLTPYLIKMVQIQQRQIEELKAEVERLKDVIES